MALLLAPAPVAAQAEGSSQLTISVDLDGQYVQVREQITVEDGDTSVTIQLPPDAVDVDIEGQVVSETTDDSALEYQLNVGSGGATVSYRLPGGEDALGDTRVAADTIGFNLWPNMTTVSAQITLPEGFRANVGADFVETEIATGTFQYVLESVDINRAYALRFVAVREEGLNRRTVEVGEGKTVEVAGWVDDLDWLDYAVEYVDKGIPALEELIGQPWPATELELIESTAPGEVGYGGWYDLRKAQIEVDDEQDPELLLHELSHAWFNDTLFQQRWMIEGFAEAYAQEAVASLGGEVTGITSPGAAPEFFQGLNRWRSRFFFEDNFDEEIYGYRSSGFVVAELLDEIGPEAMADVLDEMIDDRHPYAVESDRRAAGVNDWRRFLDLVEIHGGSIEANDLFRTYVVTEGQEELLDERREALDLFLEFEEEVADGERSQVPEGIRYAMSSWEFDDATRGLERAQEAQDRLEELASRAAAIGLALPTFLGDVYLESDTDFLRMTAALDDADAALLNLENRSEPPTADEEYNFTLGRFDQMDLSPLPDPNALNQTDSEPFWTTWYAQAAAVLIVLLVALAAIAARLPEPGEGGAEVDYSGKSPLTADQGDIPIYRPQVAVGAGASTTLAGGQPANRPSATPPAGQAAAPPAPPPPAPPPPIDVSQLPPPDHRATPEFDPNRYPPPS